MVPEGSAFPVANAFDVVVREYLLATGFLPVENRKGGRRPAAKARSRSDAERRGPAGRRRPPGLEGELSISVGAMSGQSQNCSRLGGMMFGLSRNNHVC